MRSKTDTIGRHILLGTRFGAEFVRPRHTADHRVPSFFDSRCHYSWRCQLPIQSRAAIASLLRCQRPCATAPTRTTALTNAPRWRLISRNIIVTSDAGQAGASTGAAK